MTANDAQIHERLLAELLRPSFDDLEARSAALEPFSAQVILRAALAVHGRGAIISTAFGASGLCVMDLAQQVDPEVRAYSIDTGFEFAETSALADRWQRERRLNLLRVLPAISPEEQAALHGDRLWERDPDRCCAIRKVEPNQRALAGSTLWITALRRDQGDERTRTPILAAHALRSGERLLKLAPIARWSNRDVWRHVHARDLPYNPLNDAGYPSVGCTHCTQPVLEGGAERSGRWTGRPKSECGLHSR